MSELLFDPVEHKYRLNGRAIPNVTTILKNVGLVDTKWFTKEACEKGTATHMACHYLDEDDLDMDSVAIQYLPYVEAYQLFLSEIKPKWELIEHRVYDETYWYSGTLDRMGMLMGNKVLCDLKTGPPLPWHRLQLAAYKYALIFAGRMNVLRYGLYLNKDGKYKLVEYKDRNDIKIFRAACAVYNWKASND